MSRLFGEIDVKTSPICSIKGGWPYLWIHATYVGTRMAASRLLWSSRSASTAPACVKFSAWTSALRNPDVLD